VVRHAVKQVAGSRVQPLQERYFRPQRLRPPNSGCEPRCAAPVHSEESSATPATTGARDGHATLGYRPADTTPLLEQTVGDILRAAAAAAPERAAVLEVGPGGRRALTYAELLAGGEQVARALLARFRPGEHVAVWAGNGLEWILLEYGAGLAGLVLVTVNPAYQAAELE
jgi:hypothetical protein